MTRETLDGRDAGMLYDGTAGAKALLSAIQSLLARKDAGGLGVVRQNARQLAKDLDWPDISPFFA